MENSNRKLIALTRLSTADLPLLAGTMGRVAADRLFQHLSCNQANLNARQRLNPACAR
jgi:hypothetical protein